MKIQTLRQDGVATVVLAGEIDAAQGAEVRGAIRDLLAQDETRFVFDISGVTFMGSTAVACLAQARRDAVAREGAVALVNPPPMVRKMFATLGIEAHFPVFPTREAARAALTTRGPGKGTGER